MSVTTQLKEVMKRAESWPEDLQAEAVDLLLAIEEAGASPYRIADAEWARLRIAIAQADRGEFVDEESVAAADKRLGA